MPKTKGIERVLYLGTRHIETAGATQGVPGVYRAELGRETRLTPLGLQGEGAIAGLVVDNDTPDVLYVGTGRGGMFKSEDRGATWREINKGLVYKEVWSLVQHPVTGELYVGTQPAEVFKSSDRGETWEECMHLRALREQQEWTFPGPPFVAHVKQMSVCDADSNVVWGAVEEGWLIRSIDGGKTWSNIKAGTPFDAHTAYVMPGDPRTVVATSGIGAFRSEDGGDTFVESSSGLDRRYMAPMVIKPAEPSVLFSGASDGPPPTWRRPSGAKAVFYRSEDQGRSWHPLSGGLPDELAAAIRCLVLDPGDRNTVLVGMSDGNLLVTSDWGESFTELRLEGMAAIASIAVAA